MICFGHFDEFSKCVKYLYYSGPWVSQMKTSQSLGRVPAVLHIVFCKSNLGGANSTLIYPSKLHDPGIIIDFLYMFCQ